MTELIAGSVYFAKDITGSLQLYRELKIFPTPFKGVYYAPYESERNGWYVTDPHLVIFKAVALYLKTTDYYFGLYSALYYLRTIWNAFGCDIINSKISRRINRKLPSKKYWRGKIINKLMQKYPSQIRFHRIKNFSFDGTIKKGSITLSNLEKTGKDANYLCKKGDKTTCEILKNYFQRA